MTLSWTADGAPRSDVFEDIYFQPGEGLAESRAVFLRGCGLPEAWRGRARFTVGELGFGVGLNIRALLQLWRDTRAPGQRLQVFSLEAHPVAEADARRALAVWPELADIAAPLLAAWPRRARGFHRIDLPQFDAVIDIAHLDATEALGAWTGRADAWFLDGFAPSKNPGMWSETVLGLVAARCVPGARAATFTVAGTVRRELAAHGFHVAKRPGHGRKRERLEAELPGRPDLTPPRPRVVVIGAGIAGAALARAFAAQGVTASVIAPDDPGASGNAAALVTPALDAGEGTGGRLYAQALARAADLYRATPGAVIAEGAVRLEREARDAGRFDTLAASGLFAPGALRRLDREAVAALIDEVVDRGGLWLADGMTVDPAAIRGAWLGPERITGRVWRLERSADGWRVLDAASAVLAEADVICLASGADLRRLADLPLAVIRGQVSAARAPPPRVGAAWGGYAIPTRDGLLFGATHDRAEEDVTVREADHARNRASLAQGRPALAAAIAGAPLHGRAALRVTSADRLPVAGEIAPGLFTLGGLGGRGFTMAPLLAEAVAAQALGLSSPLPADLIQAVSPNRAAVARHDAGVSAERRGAPRGPVEPSH